MITITLSQPAQRLDGMHSTSGSASSSTEDEKCFQSQNNRDHQRFKYGQLSPAVVALVTPPASSISQRKQQTPNGLLIGHPKGAGHEKLAMDVSVLTRYHGQGMESDLEMSTL